MQGRYGFDQLGQAIGIGVVVLWIVSIIFGVFSNLFGIWASMVSTILNWIGLALLACMVFRILSHNHERRRSENVRYLARRGKRQRQGHASPSDISADHEPGYTYLTCSFCNQQMRVPKGKGKIAVKCPSCGEKTIVKS